MNETRCAFSSLRLRLAAEDGLNAFAGGLWTDGAEGRDPAELVGHALAGLWYHAGHLERSGRLWEDSLSVMRRILDEKGPFPPAEEPRSRSEK